RVHTERSGAERLPRELEQDAAALRHGGPSEGDHAGPGAVSIVPGHTRVTGEPPRSDPPGGPSSCAGSAPWVLLRFRRSAAVWRHAEHRNRSETDRVTRRAPDHTDPGPYGAAA